MSLNPAEHALYLLARALSRSDLAHDDTMKDALESHDGYAEFRQGQVSHVLDVARSLDVRVDGLDVADFGCNDGAMTRGYARAGARSVVGIDIDADALARARALPNPDNVRYVLGTTTAVPLPEASVDLFLSYDVFEHVSDPAAILEACFRALRPGGRMLIGTWGWCHPFAPHLWSTMPVPWAHLLVSDRTLMAACKRVYLSPWYRPTMHDFDEEGRRKDKYNGDELSRDYMNRLLIRDFERLFRESPFEVAMHPRPFSSKLARWTKPLLGVPWVREFLTGYLWVVLTKPLNGAPHPR